MKAASSWTLGAGQKDYAFVRFANSRPMKLPKMRVIAGSDQKPESNARIRRLSRLRFASFCSACMMNGRTCVTALAAGASGYVLKKSVDADAVGGSGRTQGISPPLRGKLGRESRADIVRYASTWGCCRRKSSPHRKGEPALKCCAQAKGPIKMACIESWPLVPLFSSTVRITS